ncbi:hypothetical protein AOL_s00176g95 [Orbilia oligospora ATCC 24927]|uniref:Peptidase S8/S53 domain-containing protein n=1 Tax=Arthrobotrys oligospora (strain ATCC 24927 / CBS 115.81 / DSM 1491) TaxID=756982 RepID=G1XPX0_ARTOA|nr:hypothetical protein AOL_s00176g95 [Orbilia oligospora ATCC 24927]EGX44813.1 hypothetical protein AOL_s00176g95 [Orbilia oligospora ATCC 24927]
MSTPTETSPLIIKWGLSGFGSRHALYLIHQAMIMAAFQDELKNHKIAFKLHYTVFEKNAGKTGGFGNAFQGNCDASVNTSVTAALPPPLVHDEDVNLRAQDLAEFANLQKAVKNAMESKYDEVLRELKACNPCAADLFKRGFEDRKVIPGVAYVTRGKWGKIQLENIDKALDYIKNNMQDEIEVAFKYPHEVVGVNFDNPQKPKLKVEDLVAKRQFEEEFDFVSFANGTPLVPPFKDSDVGAKHYYSGTPNHSDMKKYLNGRGVLDDDKLKTTAKIACTGLSLSFYDYATLLLAFLPGMDTSEDPVKTVEELGRDKYKGLITVISRGSRGPAPPRTVLDENWHGVGDSFFSARDMHALRLQRNSNWLPIAYEFLEAHIARSENISPDQVRNHGSTEKCMTGYLDDCKKYLAKDNRPTKTGLLRAGYVAFSAGSGIVRDVDQAENKLVLEAKYTREGRFGIPLFGASCFEMSSKNIDKKENAKFFEHWNEQLYYNYASPVSIQRVMAAMFTSGMAVHKQGNFNGFRTEGDGETPKLVYQNSDGKNDEFDALLAPKVFRRDNDCAVSATKDIVRNIIEGVPDYGKGGYFKSSGGDPINAFDSGLGGCGAKHKDGRIVGVRWDGLTNNHHAANTWASSRSYHTLALAIARFLSRDNSESPIETVNKAFERTLPSCKDFKSEIKSFEKDWEDLKERLLFLRLAKKLAGQRSDDYYKITNNIFTPELRDEYISKLKGADKTEYEALENEFRTSKYSFSFVSCDEFERRYPDYTRLQYKAILEKLFASASRDHPAVTSAQGAAPPSSGIENPLIRAVTLGAIAEVLELLDTGTSPNFTDASGLSPLHHSYEANKKRKKDEIFESSEFLGLLGLLFEYGADPDAKDHTGSTLLHYASKEGRDRVTRLLLKYWADPNVKDNSEATPFQLAAKNKHRTIMRLLIAKGADASAGDEPKFALSGPSSEGNTGTDIATPRSEEVALKPLFPIRINGNDLNEAEIKPQSNESNTNYIIVQTAALLSPPQRETLKAAGLDTQEYVSNCTYLCRYTGQDLDKIGQIDPIVYVDIYRQEFKIAPSLKEAIERTLPDDKIEIFVLCHDFESTNDRDFLQLIADKSGLNLWDVKFIDRKTHLTVLSQSIDGIAKIDQVRYIEEVGIAEVSNNRARVTLGLDKLAEDGQALPAHQYQGAGQVIAIADTGLGLGDIAAPPHPAFGDRVVGWYRQNGFTADYDGHGTHVCASAVGNGKTRDNIHIMGTAPRANLVMHSLWRSSEMTIDRPKHFDELFRPPYTEHKARVHSNSWNKPSRGYTTEANEIDSFVWEKQDMVICWSAGNKRAGSTSLAQENEGQIGAEASAKNCITVGACEGEQDHTIVPDYSNCGPLAGDDKCKRRKKPDVVAPGTMILSARSRQMPPSQSGEDPDWYRDTGTSMATGLVAGCAAVLIEAVTANRIGDRQPSAALIKALFINGAEKLVTERVPLPIPNVRSGFGRVNLTNSIKIACQTEGAGFMEGELVWGSKKSFTFRKPPKNECTTVKATLVWSDPPGDLIKNRLFLKVKCGDRQVFSRLYNNVQQVLWDMGSVIYQEVEFTVMAEDDELDQSPQPFDVAWQFS